MKLLEELKKYEPYNEQEEKDIDVILKHLINSKDVFTRKNEIAHFTASAWVLNKERNKVLMIYHNIYKSWSWTGGHADGEENLLNVAIREVTEETGVKNVIPIKDDIFSVEILTVDGHIKNGSYVSSHLHINVTYLLEGAESEVLEINPLENSGVKWCDIYEAVHLSSEDNMKSIYKKLNQKCRDYKYIGE